MPMEFVEGSKKTDWWIFEESDLRDRGGRDESNNGEHENVRTKFDNDNKLKNRRN